MSSTLYFKVVTPVSVAGVSSDIGASLAQNVGQRTIGQAATVTDESTAVAASQAAQAANLKTNEVVSVKVDATSGNFTLTYGGATTANIAFNALASAVQSALVALATLDAGDVSVSGGPGDSGGTTPYIVQFTGPTHGGVDETAITKSNGTLAGGGAAVTVAVLVTGGATPA